MKTRKQVFRQKKGISPFIAVVLLVAFTISIGVFLSDWAHNLAKNEASQVTARANKNCAFATYNIDQATYCPEKQQLVVKITDTGTQAINIRYVIVTNKTYYQKEYQPSDFEYWVAQIDPGATKVIVIPNVIPNVTSVRVVLLYCPQNSYDIGVTYACP